MGGRDDIKRGEFLHAVSILLHYFSSLHLQCQFPVAAAPVPSLLCHRKEGRKRRRPARVCSSSHSYNYYHDEGKVVGAVQPDLPSTLPDLFDSQSKMQSQSQFQYNKKVKPLILTPHWEDSAIEWFKVNEYL